MQIKLVYLSGSIELFEVTYLLIEEKLNYITFKEQGTTNYTTHYINTLKYVEYERFGAISTIYNRDYKGE